MATPTNNPQPYTVQCVDCGKEWRQAQPPKATTGARSAGPSERKNARTASAMVLRATLVPGRSPEPSRHTAPQSTIDDLLPLLRQ